MKPQLAGDMMTALARVPEDHYVTFSKERDEEGETMFVANLFQRAPEDGWPSRGAKFRNNDPSPCPVQWMHDDSVIFGVNAGEPETLERLLIAALARRFGAES